MFLSLPLALFLRLPHAFTSERSERVGFPYAAQRGGYFICISLHTSDRRPFLPFVSSSFPPPSPPPSVLHLLPRPPDPSRRSSSFPPAPPHPLAQAFPTLHDSLVRRVPHLPSSAVAGRHARCIYFILLLNKPLPVILAPTCVFTHARSVVRSRARACGHPRQIQSPLDARIGLRDQTRKIFLSLPPPPPFLAVLTLVRVSFSLHVFRPLI